MCLVFALIVLFLVFFNTYIFQAGLVYLLVRKFRTTIIITVLYLALSVGLHVWTVVSTSFSSVADIKHVIFCEMIVSKPLVNIDSHQLNHIKAL